MNVKSQLYASAIEENGDHSFLLKVSLPPTLVKDFFEKVSGDNEIEINLQ